MKHSVRLYIVALVAGLLTAPAAHAATAPADTVAGQARFTHRLSAGMCDRLAQESQKADLSKLTGTESEALLKRVLLGAMGDNFTEFSGLMEKAPGSAAGLGRAIGERAILEMVQRCPSAGPLVAKVGGLHSGTSLEITPVERPTLLAIAQAACKQLDAENAKQPFDTLTPAQRSDLLKQVLGGAFLKSSAELTTQYGDEVMADKAQGEEIGKKIALLMLEACPSYILQAGQDELARRRQSAAAPAPTTRLTPPTTKKATAKKAPAKVR